MAQAPLQQAGPLGMQATPSGRQFVPLHTPPKHSPLQHPAPGKLQPAPLGRHTGVPQTPSKQSLLQQIAPGKPQGLPSNSQVVPPQTPLKQSSLQQSDGTLHVKPSGWQSPHVSPQTAPTCIVQPPSHAVSQQEGSIWQTASAQGSQVGERGGPMTHSGCEQLADPQVPLTPQTPLQHTVADEQGEPSAAQVEGPQIPLGVQGPLQQGTFGSQKRPSGLHTEVPQTPLAPHVPEQHCEESPHGVPSGPQFGFCAHAPSAQIMEQHCWGEEHEVPVPWQKLPHTPLLQIPSQHSEANMQAAPPGEQGPEPARPVELLALIAPPALLALLAPPGPLAPPTPCDDDRAPTPRSLRPQLARSASPATKARRKKRQVEGVEG